MTLYFLHSWGEKEKIAENVPAGADNALSLISCDLKKRNPAYKMPYLRFWEGDHGVMWFDVGSHTEFYTLEEEK